ncbi:hypothetical protein H9649_10235 [Sporosarcina sp. Sa2YVA2]|uniref:Transposase n=1 Tax=Sporosarcina quadrami TaxID=2762234 RepID=A0ABR8UB40_9BACL|nr:hypothetical protein [Sporosarcina quadrami]MBD7984964.1 hypothetical protein [Sporosarcina quadrami]
MTVSVKRKSEYEDRIEQRHRIPICGGVLLVLKLKQAFLTDALLPYIFLGQ